MVKIIVSVGALVATALAGSVTEFPKEVADLMDEMANPCTDFYKYACGGWYKNAVIPADRSTTDTSFSAIAAKNDEVIKQILASNYPKLGEYYASCKDEAKLTALGVTPIADDLKSIQSANSTTAILQIAAQLSKKNVPAFTQPAVYPDKKDATTNVLYSFQAPLTFDDLDYYKDPSIWGFLKPLYEQYIVTLFTLGSGKSAADAKAGAKVVMDFERQFAGVQLSKLEAMEAVTSTYNPMSYYEAATKYPLTVGIQLQEYGFNIRDGCLGATNKIILQDLSFFDRVEKLVAGLSLEDLKIITEFKLLNTFSTSLTPALATANWNLFGKVINGQKAEPSRESRCSTDIQTTLGEIVGDYYVKAMFDKTAATRADEMVLALEASFKQGIQNATWLDEETRKNGLTKLSKFVHLIGAPENPQKYPTLSLDGGDYVGNRNKIWTFDTDANLALIGTKVDRHKWSSPASEVNAWYSPRLNSITFPAAILQTPFFSGKADAAQNFGAIGMVIGHEITHGFDNSGRNFDGDGNLNPWWSDETSLEFNKKASCIANQYSKFDAKSEVTGQSLGKVNGRLTLGETIADNGGLKTAFRAYQTYIQTNPSKFTKEVGEKVFFLSFAQGWCSKNTDKYIQRMLKDVHPPGIFRVYGAVQNNDAFAKTFNCPVNSEMNPSEKCYLWE
ncbi:endothelin-converting enzyme, metalloprotease family M13 [Achlya hypogyna]|uniref:Endothelin-converting enzyme, metalloprotease family M13 n=1 Tax=Achlya hypogyna TaxID=1202772 RepID=A0A0A7CNF7_ACHHY|nr:secreted protein [Achlya hypogyna]OQR91069.1 endothelin-converting enzyme, metalloprotease family M13 [Achlya hypogyna]